MGVRADMTPQVARIDAHQLNRETPTRLCYMGTVLHTRNDGFAGSRSPLQVGASNGFTVTAGAEGVGKATTRSVVVSIASIILADMVFSYFQSQ